MKELPLVRRPYFANRILDIGAGHNPFRGVTHVLDMDIVFGRERGGNKLVLPGGASLVQGGAGKLPFQASTFDFVYASHVLEHVDDPEQACQELMRVGRAGFIETPSPLLEHGLAFRDETPEEMWYHKWFVFSDAPSRLIFEPKSVKEVDKFCTCPDGKFLKEFFNSINFNEAQHYLRRKAKTTMFYWRNAFEFEVRPKMMDCQLDNTFCRFGQMRSMLLASCNDVLRAPRILRFKRRFPRCKEIFQRFGHSTLWIH